MSQDSPEESKGGEVVHGGKHVKVDVNHRDQSSRHRVDFSSKHSKTGPVDGS